jgi:hypothetical protein
MGLKVDRPIIWNDQEFSGYEIVGVEWIFKTDKMYILTEYYFRRYGKNIRRLIKHEFSVGTDVNVDHLINQVHNYHK